MPTFLLRNSATSKAYPNFFDVILTMDDGYELRVGGISETWGAGPESFWAWACPGENGRAESRDGAVAAFRAAWRSTDDDLAKLRFDQEWTANKYALWDAGYRDKLGKGPIQCRCGVMFDPGIHAETMAHIEHITGRRAGTEAENRGTSRR